LAAWLLVLVLLLSACPFSLAENVDPFQEVLARAAAMEENLGKLRSVVVHVYSTDNPVLPAEGEAADTAFLKALSIGLESMWDLEEGETEDLSPQERQALYLQYAEALLENLRPYADSPMEDPVLGCLRSALLARLEKQKKAAEGSLADPVAFRWKWNDARQESLKVLFLINRYFGVSVHKTYQTQMNSRLYEGALLISETTLEEILNEMHAAESEKQEEDAADPTAESEDGSSGNALTDEDGSEIPAESAADQATEGEENNPEDTLTDEDGSEAPAESAADQATEGEESNPEDALQDETDTEAPAESEAGQTTEGGESSPLNVLLNEAGTDNQEEAANADTDADGQEEAADADTAAEAETAEIPTVQYGSEVWHADETGKYEFRLYDFDSTALSMKADVRAVGSENARTSSISLSVWEKYIKNRQSLGTFYKVDNIAIEDEKIALNLYMNLLLDGRLYRELKGRISLRLPNGTGSGSSGSVSESMTESNEDDSTFPEPAIDQDFENVQVGSVIRMGYYEQDGNADNQREPIEWKVLSINKSKNVGLVVTVKALDVMSYGVPGDESQATQEGFNWKTSHIREWLASDFYKNSFRSAERKRIRQPKNVTKDASGRFTTKDYVFLLSVEEAKRYMKSKEGMVCMPTDYARNKADQSAITQNGSCVWWLREMATAIKKDRKGNVKTTNQAGYVYGDTGTKYYLRKNGLPVDQEGIAFVRPAMWVKFGAAE